MYDYLTSKGYLILRWAEWCEDHMEYTVIAPSGAVLTAEAEWLLVEELTALQPVPGQPIWYLPQAA